MSKGAVMAPCPDCGRTWCPGSADLKGVCSVGRLEQLPAGALETFRRQCQMARLGELARRDADRLLERYRLV